MEKSTTFNIITTFITRFLILFGNFIISILIARLLGPEGKGMLTAILVIPTLLLTLADMGIRQATAYYIGKKIYSDNTIVTSLLIIWFGTSLLGVIVTLLIYNFQFGNDYSNLILYIASSIVPITLGYNYLKGILQGKNLIININLAEIIKIVIYLLNVIILLWLFELELLGAIIANVINVLFMFLYTIKIVKRNVSFNLNFRKRLIIKPLLVKGLTFAIALFFIQLNYRIDILFLEKLTTASDVGLYSIGINISEIVWQIPAAVGMVIFSKSAISKNSIESTQKTIKLVRVIIPIVLIICLMIGILSRSLIYILYGEAFINSTQVIQLLLPGVFVMVIFKILHSDLSGQGYPLYGLYATIFPLVIKVVMNYKLIPIYGIEGAAVTSSISYLLTTILLIIMYKRKESLRLLDILIIKSEDIKDIKNIFNKILNR